jgi:predicted DNA-binding protein (UPF0251 family)
MFQGVEAGTVPRVRSSNDRVMVTGDAPNTVAVMTRLLERSGMSGAEAARRMGLAKQTVHQMGRSRQMVSVKSLARFAAVCGGRLVMELP